MPEEHFYYHLRALRPARALIGPSKATISGPKNRSQACIPALSESVKSGQKPR